MLSLAAILLAACGSSSDDEAASGSSTESSAGGGAAPAGEPIKVMTEAPIDTNLTPYPNIRDAAKFYAQWINEKGGINGRPLEVIFCDDKNDPNEAGNCARKAVEEKVIANVGSFTIDVSRGIPIYEENDIAWFGACCPIVAQENTSKISFPMGFVGGFPTAAAIQMVEDGCKSIATTYGDLPVADVFHGLFVNGWKAAGQTSEVKMVKTPLAPGDYSAEIAKMTSPDIDCLFGNIGEANWPSVITALNSAGKSPRLYGPQGNLDAKVAADFPEETDGAVVLGVYPDMSDAVFADYRAALEKYDASDDIDWNSLGGLGTWTAYVAFTKIVEGMDGEITSKTFLDAASKTTDLDTGGMVANLDFTKEWDGAGGDFPRIFNRNIFVSGIKDGKMVAGDPEPIDVSNAVDGKK
ncbi:MAG: ABC transporter substrate-binding protein [Acidimicrobiia bacterium]|nr:ABC transporter substrate-binding protein [Acidimicrobiia bacterium]